MVSTEDDTSTSSGSSRLVIRSPPHVYPEEQHSHTRSQQSRPTSQRHPKRDSTYAGIPSRELARMLVQEAEESARLKKMLVTLTSQLRGETQRADDADRRARDLAVRMKAVVETKFEFEQEAFRLNEELSLYKIQLGRAQDEIHRAQKVLNDVEAQRAEAEEAVARARSVARKLKEQTLVDIAREEGRRMGIEEGLSRGRDLGFRQGRAAGYSQARLVEEEATLEEIEDEDEDKYRDHGHSTSSGPSRPPSPAKIATPQSRSRSTHNPSPNFTDPPDRNVLVPPAVTTPARIPSPQPAPSPPVVQSSIPPDGWIPSFEEGSIRLPPPHELSPRLNSPGLQSFSRLQRDDEPILMMRPPQHTSPHNSERDLGSSHPRRPRHVRRPSDDSQASTTFSSLDILTPPKTKVTQPRENLLDSIREERSPSSASHSPNRSSDHGRESPHGNSPHGTYRSPQSFVYPTPTLDQLASTSPNTPSSMKPQLRKADSQSSEEYNFDIVPPSRPTSGTYGPGPEGAGALSSNMLSANDANNRALPRMKEEPQVQQPPIVNQLPAGFVPFTPRGSPSSPGVPSPRQATSSAAPGYPYYSMTGGHSVEEPDTEPVIPASSRTRKKSQSVKSGSTSTKDNYRRKARPADSDEEVSSDLSSDSMGTPPARGTTPLPIYALTPSTVVASLPPTAAVPSSGRTATRAPLPPSSAGGTPRSTKSRSARGHNKR